MSALYIRLNILTCLILIMYYKVGSITVFTLQMRILRHREVKEQVQR